MKLVWSQKRFSIISSTTSKESKANQGIELAISSSLAAKESFGTSSSVAIIDVIIPPGTRQEFHPEADKARVCLLVGGKLRVQVGEEAQFSVGSRGRFRVGPKIPCSVVNWSYENVVLTVISESLHGTNRRRL